MEKELVKNGIAKLKELIAKKKDKKERKKESSLDVADARANAARKESVLSAGNEPKHFEIEISNPFFTGPSSIVLHDQSQVQKNVNQIAKPGAAKESKTSQNGDAQSTQNQFVLTCNPTKPASFTCYVILKSLDRTDIRLYEYKLTAIP